MKSSLSEDIEFVIYGEHDIAAGRVARLNVPDCTVTMRRQLFYHKDKWLTPQMKAFMELAQQSPAEATC